MVEAAEQHTLTATHTHTHVPTGVKRDLNKHLMHDGTFKLSLHTQYAYLRPGDHDLADAIKHSSSEAAAAADVVAGSTIGAAVGGVAGGTGYLNDDDACSAGMTTSLDEPNPAIYHVRLLQLLTACCYGHNFEVEAKCQGLISLPRLVEALQHPSLPLEVRMVLHEYFLEVWLFTERLPVEVVSR